MKKLKKQQATTLYFDYAVTAPVIKSVIRAMSLGRGVVFSNLKHIHIINNFLVIDIVD